MRRGTTPANIFTVNVDLTDATVFVSYEQDGRIVVEKTGEDLTVTSTTVETMLTQEETLAFHPGRVYVQIRYVTEEGTADASNIIATTTDRIIKDGVIEYV